ncbi:GH3 auxin-responsive promoter family protein [Treponema sp.]|uniref:GH3 auxin-responsive promoter family protein n=1 Tax=Treponema sp. TaxID=166 RepID=UPI0025CC195D|nr:GH3 auxin-responsive promoter family protein [Treponema sp.]
MGLVGKIQLHKLNKAAKNCSLEQEKTLRGILEYAKDSEWGKAHNFAKILEAKNAQDLYSLWQQNVPAQDYEDLRPFIERHKNGEENVLFPGKPKMYATTSGTTKEPKWIPITNEYYENVYSKMTRLWLYSFMMHRPKVFEGKCVSIVGKAIEGAAPDGTVYGSVSGVTQRDCPEFIKGLYSAPNAVFKISDYRARYYTIMRTGIEQNVHLVVTANPSTIVEMQNNVNEFFDDYVKDIENGTLNANLKIDDDIRESLAPCYKPNPKRAAELRALKEKYGTVLPKHYWPELQVLTTWKCGNTHVYMDKFANSFPKNMLHQEFGYFASECRAGLVMNGADDTVLFPHAHYFEFVRVEDMENANPRFYQLDELEVGKRYLIYVTTYAGLYRYNMNDMIEVTGHYKTIPTIQFLQKVNGIISMTGEKLHERQFIEAVKNAEKETGISTKFFVGFADLELSTYRIYVEFADQDTTQETADSFGKVIDKHLKAINCEYESKRDSFRVKDPIIHMLQKESFETYKSRCIDQGARDGQFKLNLLMQDEKRHAMFKDLIKK